MADIIIIEQRLVNVTNIDVFRHSEGEKVGLFRRGLPYWIRLSDGTMWFDYLAEHTSRLELEKQLKAGQLWVRPSDRDLVKEVKHA